MCLAGCPSGWCDGSTRTGGSTGEGGGRAPLTSSENGSQDRRGNQKW